MSQADARAWWADVEHLRERIERRRELEHAGEDDRRPRGASGRARRSSGPSAEAPLAARRTVGIRGQAIPTVTAPRLHVVEEEPDFLEHAWQSSRSDAPRPAARDARRRPPRSPAERVGERPDRIAMWAVVLGIVMVLAALLSAHGF